MQKSDFRSFPHRRQNILTGDWILVSPHRTERPWQGEISSQPGEKRRRYEPECYLCPGNVRANGERNPPYEGTFVFTNDFSALLEDIPLHREEHSRLLPARSEPGTCRVVNFSPRHDLTLAQMSETEILGVIDAWQSEFRSLGSRPHINYVQIFENKGSLMGNSNPHPHCQIWAQQSVPLEPSKEGRQMKKYFRGKKRSLLGDYLKLEIKRKERMVYENSSHAVIVPFWAVWPYETMIVPKRKMPTLLQLRDSEKRDFANALSVVTSKYDNLFKISFPYSSGVHQAPTDGASHPEWHLHMHFYPPLLRSASIKKFMVGYEMLAEPQRDITAERSAEILRNLPEKRFEA